MDQFRAGLGDAWASIATFMPKLIGFLVVLVVGYFIAKSMARLVDGVLERVGFDRMVERGGIGRALESSRLDASDILGKVVFYVLFLFVLQVAFGVFGSNPVSDLITGMVAYLPNVFVAIVVIVVGAAIAAAVKEIVEAALGGLGCGKAVAVVASTAVLVLAAFAALDQLQIAPSIVRGLYFALLAIVVGSSVVAIGGGGIQTMRRYWERVADRAELESDTIRQQARGARDRVTERADDRRRQFEDAGPGRPAVRV
jgi:Conserved TM helix